MAAPEYVPIKPLDDVRTYESPPRRPEPWMPKRPGDLRGENPRGELFGDPGPDQGYGLVLANRLRERVHLQANESMDDVVVGCLSVGLKRASLLGRAPVIHDMTVAYTVWGYLDDTPAAELASLRRRLFDECAVPAHYLERRRIVATVRDEALRQMHAAIADAHRRDWRSLLHAEG